jgi:hypothetical protein
VRRIKIKKKVLKQYWGYAYPEEDRIEIDPRLRSRRFLNTLIHEILHVLYPNDSETKISENADTITHYIWHENYRRIDK